MAARLDDWRGMGDESLEDSLLCGIVLSGLSLLVYAAIPLVAAVSAAAALRGSAFLLLRTVIPPAKIAVR